MFRIGGDGLQRGRAGLKQQPVNQFLVAQREIVELLGNHGRWPCGKLHKNYTPPPPITGSVEVGSRAGITVTAMIAGTRDSKGLNRYKESSRPTGSGSAGAEFQASGRHCKRPRVRAVRFQDCRTEIDQAHVGAPARMPDHEVATRPAARNRSRRGRGRPIRDHQQRKRDSVNPGRERRGSNSTHPVHNFAGTRSLIPAIS